VADDLKPTYVSKVCWSTHQEFRKYGRRLWPNLELDHIQSSSAPKTPNSGSSRHAAIRYVSAPKLPACDQTAVNSLPQRLAYKRPLGRAGLYQMKNRSQRPSVFVARSGLYFAPEQVAIMEHDNAWDFAVAPKVRRNGHLELRRAQSSDRSAHSLMCQVRL
jgi:hypothetical protein